MAIEKLTQTMVDALMATGNLPRRKKGARGREGGAGWYGDGGNLYLQLKPELTASWVFRYKRDGKTRVMGLGPLHTVDLAEARKRAAKHRLTVLDGLDPQAGREPRTVWTFLEAATHCHKVASQNLSNEKDRKAWLTGIETYAAALLTIPVRDVTLEQVAGVLRPIWAAQKGRRLRERLEKVFDFASVNNQRTAENPALLKQLKFLLGAHKDNGDNNHLDSLPYDRLPAFMADLRARDLDIAALALEFLILTAVRSSDVRNMRWEHVKDNCWTIPAMSKTKMEFVVPLSDAALAVLERVRALGFDEGQIIFASPIKRDMPIGERGMPDLLRKMWVRDATIHGFRATFKTWASEQQRIANDTVDGIQGNVVEVAMGHRFSKNKVEAAYMRGALLEKRARLMAAWADFAGGGNKVVKLVAGHRRGT